MRLVTHGKRRLIFGEVYPVLVLLNTEWDFGKVMIINPVTGNMLALRLPGKVAEDFCQPILKHDNFLLSQNVWINRDHPFLLNHRNPTDADRQTAAAAHQSVRKLKCSATCDPPEGPSTWAVDQA